MPAKIEELTLEVDGLRTRCWWAEGVGTPTVFCHGNPTHGEEWLPFLERKGPALAIDMPGWGRSVRPGHGQFDHTMHELSAFLDRCLDQLRIDRHNLVVHDWGALALIGAQRLPERVQKLVVINAVPLLPGYRWHWVARIWRRRILGELANATTTKASMALTLRQARGDRSPMPREFVEMIWRYWDRGTKRAILQLYRDADPDRLAAAGRDLGRLTCPSLILWGDRDPYLPTKFALDYAQVLPNAELEIVQGAGHWPLIDDPAVVDRVLEFVR
ncbi:MAG TPA: alpha/beta hydrolase [Solirubrobacterales bacterium]|nr:alpha/beta hydrolase [Solirubrobacterales bacterium]